MIKVTAVFLLISASLVLSSCIPTRSANDNHVMVTSVSSDGHYAITTNQNQQAYLWDLQNHTYKVIADSVNIYSAYFIKGTDNFMYQKNGSNTVIVQNTAGKLIKQFNPGFATYGEIINSDLTTYVASNQNFSIFMIRRGVKRRILSYYCPPDLPKHNPPKQPKASIWGCMSFMGGGKLFNLAFSSDEETIVGTSYGYLVMWNASNGALKGIIQKTSGQTVNAIAPSGQYVVVGDQQGQGFLYDIANKRVSQTTSDGMFFFDMPVTRKSVKSYFYDKDNYRSSNFVNQVIAVKFVDDQHFVVSINGAPIPFLYLGLYKLKGYRHEVVEHTPVTDLSLVRYLRLMPSDFNLYLGQPKPWPETRSFVRDQAMDTSPSAHVLVMGQANHGGIMVYHYDPKTQTLKLVWAPTLQDPPQQNWYY